MHEVKRYFDYWRDGTCRARGGLVSRVVAEE